MESQNLRLVNYFTSKFYRDHTIDLAHIASPTFKYSSNSNPYVNFEDYAKNRDIFNKNVELTLSDFQTEDDIHFITFFEVKLKNGKVFNGEMTLKVVRGLLEEIKTKHNLSDEEYKVMKQSFLED